MGVGNELDPDERFQAYFKGEVGERALSLAQKMHSTVWSLGLNKWTWDIGRLSTSVLSAKIMWKTWKECVQKY